MKVLFVHQNMPGQFKHLAPAMARDPANEVVFITRRQGKDIAGVRTLTYQPSRTAHASTHHYVRLFENSVLHGQQIVRLGLELRQQGFVPDLVVGHTGWGETLFVKDVFPSAPLLSYCEYYYQSVGGDVGFDPSQPATLDSVCRLRARDAHLLLALEACDRGWSPTRWQKSRHPSAYQDKISVIFDGIDTDQVRPDPSAALLLPNGRTLTRADEVVTYVARNLEPYRGFPNFVRALPELLRRRPRAEIVVIGGDEVSYGTGHESGRTWREVMLEEVEFDRTRVHFLGRVPFGTYVSALQISTVHVYLTVPFVLSWSFMEAMAAGCVLVASGTKPVLEVLTHGENGLVTDFFSPARIAADVEAAVEHPGREALSAAARRTVLERYDLRRCLPAQMRLLEEVAQQRHGSPAAMGRPVHPPGRPPLPKHGSGGKARRGRK